MSTTKPTVAIVAPYTSAALVAPALRAAGMSPVAVIDCAGPDLTPFKGAHDPDQYDAVINHHGDTEATIARLGALAPDWILCGVEASLRLNQDLADALTPHCSNVAELVDQRRHKYLMHQALAEAGLPIARQICTADIEEAAAWIEREGLTGKDLVLKPTMSAATINVSRARNGEGWRDHFTTLLGMTDKLGVVYEDVLVQEYLTGVEYAIDTVSHDGHHSVTDIIRYRKVPNAGGDAAYDSVTWLPYDSDEVKELLEYGLAALDAVGLRHWAAHTEIMMTPDGPRLLEINARLAGAGNPNVTEIATGESQVTRIVDVCAGKGPAMPAGYELRQHVTAVFLMAHSAGVVKNAEILEEARDLPSYHSPVHLVSTGDHVEASTDLVTSMSMGYIILAHERAEQVEADREAIRELERKLIIEPGV